MKDLNNEIFSGLFKEAVQKCFGFPLADTLSETESRHLSNKIFDSTGLVIGAKSIRNYSAYIIHGAGSKHENPSVATLDTLARYVSDAPYTDEVQRKDREGHFPYWYQYKNSVGLSVKKPSAAKPGKKRMLIAGAVLLFIVLVSVWLFWPVKEAGFTDEFNAVQDDSLAHNGWFVKDKDPVWWNKRNIVPSHLSLYTLRGDSWSDVANTPVIKNLLLRKISSDCFSAEIHIDGFIPQKEWQQVGILLMEDTTFSARTIRLSIAFNDFFGGFQKPHEILLQGVSSNGADVSKPEEIAHIPIFSLVPGQEVLIASNLQKSALRIEKNNNHFRFLFAAGQVENFAFKEAFTKDLPVKPRYIGLFALQGFVNDTSYMPAHISFFNYSPAPCNK
jgi:hypothetical protein